MADKYYYALGRRKTSVATVRLYEGSEPSTINGKKAEELYVLKSDRKNLLSPFKVTDTMDKFYFTAHVKGGGRTGQLESVRLAIARALVKYDEDLKSALKKFDLLTRDSRMVERKKAGKPKARKSPQFSKR